MPSIDEATTLFPRRKWGQSITTLRPEPAGHVRIEVNRDPYGLLMCGVCEYCGGRSELILDSRDLEGVSHAEKDGREGGQLIQREMQIIIDSLLIQWAPTHKECASSPRQFHTPAEVQTFVDSVLKAATADIARGISFSGYIVLLTTDGQAYALPVHDIPPRVHPTLIE